MADDQFAWVDDGNRSNRLIDDRGEELSPFDLAALRNRRGINVQPRTIPLATGLGNTVRIANKLMTDPAARSDLGNRLTGTVGGEDRMTLWPERMARGIVGTAQDISSGDFGTVRPNAAGMVSDEDITKRQQRDFQGVQDLSNLVVGGSLPMAAARGIEKGALGTGAVPKIIVEKPIFTELQIQARLEHVLKEVDSHTDWDRMSQKSKDAWRQTAIESLEKEHAFALERGKEPPKPPAPVFYSGVENALEHSTTATATPDQWLATIKNTRGVKPEEMQWLGIEDFLAEKKAAGEKVTRAELQDHIRSNKIEVKEVKKAGQELDEATIGDAAIKETDIYMIENHPELQKGSDEYNSYWNEAFDANVVAVEEDMRSGGAATKYSDYQLPGGKDYGELLLTMPENTRHNGRYVVTDDGNFHMAFNTKTEANDFIKSEMGQQSTKPLRIKEDMAPDRDKNYSSSHWDEPNVLAHVRYNTRDIKGSPEVTDLKGNKIELPKSIADNDNRVAGNAMAFLEEALQKELGWVRGRDYLVNMGKDKKTLHLEEIQSDWHQAGRKQGYASEASKDEFDKIQQELVGTRQKLAETTARIRKEKGLSSINDDLKLKNTDADAARASTEHRRKTYEEDAEHNGLISKIKELEEKQNRANPVGKAPDAPFKKSWPELAFKRMLRHAAENGYDAISWTPGEAQAARYDLSKHVDSIGYQKRGENYNITVWGKNNDKVYQNQSATLADIEKHLGKEMAEKIQAGVGGNNKKGDISYIEDADLKVGGEGMKRFYDDQLAVIANKYGKAHGVKVEKKPIPVGLEITKDLDGKAYIVDDPKDPDFPLLTFKSKKEAEDYIKGHSPPDVHYMELPKSLHEHALQKGFPLFSHGVMLTPVDGNPFDKKDEK